ncbi:hypothetical protein [Pseudomonas cerasi]|uniref:hypothetical protein n=1 Tax=Pseudomonas cerasi TaxID=1583341 RepID=UPI0016558629|nr:hypothetical protein [Pseudomonas cerasi]MBC8877876.1 hypothetical protein [Pseudomonas cerasi]
MRSSYRGLLKRIYDSNSLPGSEVFSSVKRRHNDHHDFYPLIALMNSAYIGYTGPMPAADVPFRDTMIAHSFQAYSQGPGPQVYESTHVMGGLEDKSIYFYIGPKGIEFFEARRADNKKLLISALLSLLAGITVALVSYYLRS